MPFRCLLQKARIGGMRWRTCPPCCSRYLLSVVDLAPFILFFGVHPLLNELQLRFKINKWICFAVKAIWFDGAMWLFWWLIVQTTGVTWIDQYMLPIILVGGTLLFFVYDIAFFKLRGQVFALVRRISKK